MKKAITVMLGLTIAGFFYSPSRASDLSLFGAYWNTRDFNSIDLSGAAANMGVALRW